MAERAPIGCTEEEARAYLGLSEFQFVSARRRGVIVPICKGTYSYNLLDRAMRLLEEEAIAKSKKINVIHLSHEDTSDSEEEPTRNLGSQGPRPRYPKTEELLRQNSGRG